MAIPNAPTNKKTNKAKMDEYMVSIGRTPANAPSSPNANKPTAADRVLTDTGVAPPTTGMAAVTAANIGVNTAPKTTPGATPSSPEGYNPAGNGGTGNAPSAPNANKPTNVDRIQAVTGVAPPPAIGAGLITGASTGVNTATNTSNTANKDTSDDTDAEKDNPGDEKEDPGDEKEDAIDISAMLQGIIDSASSSDSAATDTALKEYFDMLGVGKTMADQYAGWMDEALKGAGAVDTNNAMWGTAQDIINNNVARGDDFASLLKNVLGNAEIASIDNPMIGAVQDLIEFNKRKSDAYSNNVYGNVDWMKNTGTELMDYMKGYNPLNTDWGRGVLDYYGIQSIDASNNANAAGAADNGGNIDSYAAANAERQRLSTLGQGINAISGMTNDRFANLLNTFNSIGVNVKDLLGLEGQYNLSNGSDQLKTISDLAGTLAAQNVNAMNNYYDFNKDIAGVYGENLLPFFNNQAINASAAANTMSGNALTADKQSKDHLQNVLIQGGANLLPFIQGITDTAGIVGNNLYGTDADSTIALYNLINGVYGNGTEDSDTTVTLPGANDVIDYVSSAISNGLISRDDLSKSGGVDAFVDEMIKTYPAYANSRGYLIDIITKFINSGNGGATASAAGVNTATS